jgi:hypothetical protein
MEKMLPLLPSKDYELCKKFLKNRDFNSLLEIVNSNIYLIRENQQKEEPNEKYINLDLDGIIELSGLITEYKGMIEPDDVFDEESYEYY